MKAKTSKLKKRRKILNKLMVTAVHCTYFMNCDTLPYAYVTCNVSVTLLLYCMSRVSYPHDALMHHVCTLVFLIIFLSFPLCNLSHDGNNITQFISSLQQIHSLIMSLNFTGIEIKTINSLDSWKAGLLVMVSGSVKAKDFSGRRKFVQSFFLAPQDKGFFVLNDIFQFIDEEVIYQDHSPLLSENNFDSQLNASGSFPEPSGILT